VSKRYPRELIRHLKEVRHYTIDNPEEGIYYVIGDILPIQIIVTNRLSPEKNLWLYSLTDTLKDMSVTRHLLEDYKKNKENQLYQAVMEIIVKANENRLKEGKRDMCNALLELMKDELDEKREEGIREGIKEGESLGENRINQLILKLSELNRTDEILKAAADREYQKKLLKELGL
jgi:ribosomal protein S20